MNKRFYIHYFASMIDPISTQIESDDEFVTPTIQNKVFLIVTDDFDCTMSRRGIFFWSMTTINK